MHLYIHVLFDDSLFKRNLDLQEKNEYMTYPSLIKVVITTLFDPEKYTVHGAISFIHGTAYLY